MTLALSGERTPSRVDTNSPLEVTNFMLDSITKSLNFDPKVFLMQVVMFLLLWGIMKALYWKPVLGRVQSRHDEIERAHTTVEQTRNEIENIRNDYQARILVVETEARTQIQTAIKEAQAERERILAQARADAEATLKEGIARIERDKEEGMAQLRERIANLALDVAGKALGGASDRNALRPLIAERVQSSGGDPARN